MIDWNIISLSYHRNMPELRADLDVKMTGLYADRFALGYRDKRVGTPDPGNTERDLQKELSETGVQRSDFEKI